jgi:hypothetical protein
MRMIEMMPLAALALALAACGGGKEQKPAAESAAATLTPGLYEMTSEVTQLASTDNTTPATKLKQGATFVTRACVADGGKPAPELLAEEGDKCEIKNSYIRNGRMSAQMSCTREGMSGQVMPAMMGSFKDGSFEGEITTMTYFIKEGDYRMKREVSAKRVGECPPPGAEPAAPAAS